MRSTYTTTGGGLAASPYVNPRPRAGLFDRNSVVSASVLRSSSMPATNNGNNGRGAVLTASSPYKRVPTNNSYPSAPLATATAQPASGIAPLSSPLVRAGSAAAGSRRPASSSGALTSTVLANNNSNFLSHTVSRTAQRSRLGIAGNSPMQDDALDASPGFQQQQQQQQSKALAGGAIDSSSVTPVRNLRASPAAAPSPSPAAAAAAAAGAAASRGLFSPLSSFDGSVTPARSEFSLPSPSASPSPLSAGDYSSGSSSPVGRFGLPPSSPAAKPASSSSSAATVAKAQHHNHHHNFHSLLPPLQRKAQCVLTETTNLVAQQQQQQRNSGGGNLARSPSGDDLGINIDAGVGGGIYFDDASSSSSVAHYTIVFDLDETLCNNRGPTRAIMRPYAAELLRDLAAHRDHLRRSSGGAKDLEIVLWTASMDDVAIPVVRRLDPDGTIFDHCIYRDYRWFKNEANYTKDLKLLGRDMRGVCIVENSPVSVRMNRQHAILVRDFTGLNYRDTELQAVRDVLLNWINSSAFVPVDRYLASHPLVCPRTNYVKQPPTAATTAATLMPRAAGGYRYF